METGSSLSALFLPLKYLISNMFFVYPLSFFYFFSINTLRSRVKQKKNGLHKKWCKQLLFFSYIFEQIKIWIRSYLVQNIYYSHCILPFSPLASTFANKTFNWPLLFIQETCNALLLYLKKKKSLVHLSYTDFLFFSFWGGYYNVHFCKITSIFPGKTPPYVFQIRISSFIFLFIFSSPLSQDQLCLHPHISCSSSYILYPWVFASGRYLYIATTTTATTTIILAKTSHFWTCAIQHFLTCNNKEPM